MLSKLIGVSMIVVGAGVACLGLVESYFLVALAQGIGYPAWIHIREMYVLFARNMLGTSAGIFTMYKGFSRLTGKRRPSMMEIADEVSSDFKSKL